MAHHVNDVTLNAKNYTTPGDITRSRVEQLESSPELTIRGACPRRSRTAETSVGPYGGSAGAD